MLRLLWLAATQHPAEDISEQVAHAALLLCLLGAAHEHACEAAQIQSAAAFSLPEYAHYDGRQDGQQFHDLSGAKAGRFSDLLSGHFLFIAENMVEHSESVGCLRLSAALKHAPHHTGEVVEHGTVVITVKGVSEGGKAAFCRGIVGKAAQKRSKNAIGSLSGLLGLRADVFRKLTDHIIGKLALKDVH